MNIYVIVKLEDKFSEFLDIYDGVENQVFFSEEEAEQYGADYLSVLYDYSNDRENEPTVVNKFIVECLELDI